MSVMKKQEILRATTSALIVWIIGVTAFVASHLISLMENPSAPGAAWVRFEY